MFNSKERTKQVYAKVKLSDGRCLTGRFVIAETSSLLATLNGEGKFAIFVDYHDNHKLIAKSSIVEANEKRPEKVKSLPKLIDDGFDPYKILAIEHNTPFEVIERQYQRLARRYHPARYTHPEMPAEIASYARSMSRLLEQAYQAVCADSVALAESA